MNFSDLYKKIVRLDEGLTECGMDQPEAPKQQDTVSMNVSMNGSGENGIRDLLRVLRDIENLDGKAGGDDQLFGEPHELGHEEPVMGDSYENSMPGGSDKTTLDISSVLPTGDDLASKGKEAPKQAGGGNPWNVSESAISDRLAKHYREVKSRSLNENQHGVQIVKAIMYSSANDKGEELFTFRKGDRYPMDNGGGVFFYSTLQGAQEDAVDPEMDQHVQVPHSKGSDIYAMRIGNVLGVWDDNMKLVRQYNSLDEINDDIDNGDLNPKDFIDWDYEGHSDSSDDDYDYDYDDYDDDRGWQDAQNSWEQGRDSRY